MPQSNKGWSLTPKTLRCEFSIWGQDWQEQRHSHCSVDIWPLDGPAALCGAVSTRLRWFAPSGQTTPEEQRNEKSKHNVAFLKKINVQNWKAILHSENVSFLLFLGGNGQLFLSWGPFPATTLKKKKKVLPNCEFWKSGISKVPASHEKQIQVKYFNVV